MENRPDVYLSRHHFLRGCLGLAAAALAGLPLATARAAVPLSPTPECRDGDDPTPPQTAGPFFKPDSPRRASLLEPGAAGERIVLSGYVLSRSCRPIPGALLDVWHADADGQYDNAGHRFRGHQFADAQGRYRLETLVPGGYWSRTPHYHVRVQAPKGPILTTQLYFPGEPRNQRDFLFRPELLMSVERAREEKRAAFHFVLNVP